MAKKYQKSKTEILFRLDIHDHDGLKKMGLTEEEIEELD